MQKDNQFKSSKFYMDVGDILHILIKDESGNTITFDLKGDEEDILTVPGQPTIDSATDITATSFKAHWYFNQNTTGYYLDVATDSAFTSLVAGYNNKSVGNVNEYSVVGLTANTPYYYRVRAVNPTGVSISSDSVLINTSAIPANDWFLPSLHELSTMINILAKPVNIGNFDLNGVYWSSFESSANNAYVYDIPQDGQLEDSKGDLNKVRPCRTFVSAINYSIGSPGPSGGYIFKKIAPNTYFESAPSDLSSTSAWSNIINALVDNTLDEPTSAVHGLDNSNLIVAQVGHTDSAAKRCLDHTTS